MRVYILAAILIFLLASALAWRFTSLQQWLETDRIIDVLHTLRTRYDFAVFLVLGVYVLANLIMFPVTILIIATIVVFGPLLGYLYSVAGMMLSAMLVYGAGYALGYDLLERWKDRRWFKQVNQHLERRGIMAIIVLRMLPVAPFTLINLLTGASHIRFFEYTVGSFLGFLANVFTVTFIYIQIETAARAGRGEDIFSAIGLSLLLIAVVIGLRWLLVRIEVTTFQNKNSSDKNSKEIK